MILSSTGWLDDVIINAAQDLLKEQFEISGFQNTTLGCNLSFDILRSEFVQILHNGKNHWLTTSTVGLPAATVNVYDSFNQSLSQSTVNQVCALIFTRNQTIDVRFIDVEPQTNSSDCGVYAIAFATSLCFCEDISSIQYCVSKMRTHLVSCLEKRQMAPFPSIQRKSTLSHSILAQQRIPVSCSCRMPPAGRMIQCSHCKEQFHKKCERVTRNELSSSWQCRLCAKK